MLKRDTPLTDCRIVKVIVAAGKPHPARMLAKGLPLVFRSNV